MNSLTPTQRDRGLQRLQRLTFAAAAGGASMAVTWPRLLGRPALNRAGSSEFPPLPSLDA